jgi:hypothetical protein
MTAKKVFSFFLFLLVTVKAQEASEALLEALSFVPTSINSFEFTDITLIKEYERFSKCDSKKLPDY